MAVKGDRGVGERREADKRLSIGTITTTPSKSRASSAKAVAPASTLDVIAEIHREGALTRQALGALAREIANAPLPPAVDQNAVHMAVPPNLPHRIEALRVTAHDQQTELSRRRWDAAMARPLSAKHARFFAPRALAARIERKAWGASLRLTRRAESAFLVRSGAWSDVAGRVQVNGGVSGASGGEFFDLPNYIARGDDPSARPASLFDQAYYLSVNPDVVGAPMTALTHYLLHGEREDRQCHPLFNIDYYRKQLGTTGLRLRKSLLAHFLMFGGARGLSSHPLFDVGYYFHQAGALLETGQNPLVHYLSEGWKEGLDPHPLFNNDWYLEQNPDVARVGMAPLAHYVLKGAAEGRQLHPLFDATWYMRRYPDAAASRMNPLEHYLSRPVSERRQASPHFDPDFYLRANPDVEAAGVEPLVHYLTKGHAERRRVSPSFDEHAFLLLNPAAIDSRRAPFELWVAAGAPALPTIKTIGTEAAVPSTPSSGGAPHQSQGLFAELARGSRETNDAYDYFAYHALTADLAHERRERISALRSKPIDMISLDPKTLASEAAKLRFVTPKAPKVSIVVPVYNNLKYTIECLKSLYVVGELDNVEILIMDDASKDKSGEVLATIEGVQYVRNEPNLGFILSCNKAVGLAKGKIVIFLNNDVQVQAGWLAPLVAELDDPEVGAVAPMLLFPNGRLQEAGARINLDGSAELIGLFDDPEMPRYNYPRFVDYASGACLAVRRADFLALEGFDQSFVPAYCEDADLCFRLQAAGKRIRYAPASRVVHHLSVTSQSMGDDFKVRQAFRNQQKFVERWSNSLAERNRVKVIAFYLPQFHAIPENDKWWGAGFTEWTNVTRALPNFEKHYQPHRPAELGFYDVTHPTTMQRQAELAREHGVDGFCFYYYSFSGKRVMDRPLEQILADPDWDFPFCICWANENWTRTWDGQEKAVLLSQRYSKSDLDALIQDAIRHMRHPAYIRIDGRPLFIVYRPGLIPNIAAVGKRWRQACRKAGIAEIYLTFVENFENALTYPDPSKIGFDATVEFPPAGMSAEIAPPGPVYNPNYGGTVCDYHEVVRKYGREPTPGHTRFRGAMPSWDNTARRQDVSYVFQNASPGAFQAWLEHLFKETRAQNYGDERIVFINAWNEWAEGAHLEPDERFGRGWLDAVRNAHDAPDVLLRRD
ncbi:glycoside hydrolase family 99-like domain-containing protein [Caulobacter sp. DWP3-1-3b2]|uniref:glycoside hydrolase family 99-like domain-containing protein n=1 Tax=Caulobacter sp. DWP3-1-3b2 TaxID=2804643 RepID=UPI003CFA2BE7